MPLYQGTSDNVIGGPGRVLITASTYAAPTRITEIIDTTTYAVNATYGWLDIGLTEGEINIRVGADTEEWASAQFGRFRTVPTNFQGEVQFTAMEGKQATKLRSLAIANAGTQPVTNEMRTDLSTVENFPTKRIAVLMRDHLGRLHAHVMPKAQWGGDNFEFTLARGKPALMPVTMKLYGDDQLTNATSGQAIIEYQLDQE